MSEQVRVSVVDESGQRTPGTATLVRDEDTLTILDAVDPVDEDGNPLCVPEGSRLVLHLIPRHVTEEVPVVTT